MWTVLATFALATFCASALVVAVINRLLNGLVPRRLRALVVVLPFVASPIALRLTTFGGARGGYLVGPITFLSVFTVVGFCLAGMRWPAAPLRANAWLGAMAAALGVGIGLVANLVACTRETSCDQLAALVVGAWQWMFIIAPVSTLVWTLAAPRRPLVRYGLPLTILAIGLGGFWMLGKSWSDHPLMSGCQGF